MRERGEGRGGGGIACKCMLYSTLLAHFTATRSSLSFRERLTKSLSTAAWMPGQPTHTPAGDGLLMITDSLVSLEGGQEQYGGRLSPLSECRNLYALITPHWKEL